MTEAGLQRKLKALNIVHTIIFLGFIFTALSLIWTSPATIYFSVGAVGVAIIQIKGGRKCPLTVYEQGLKRKLGIEQSDNQFVASLIKKYLRVKVPNFLINTLMLLIFFGSAYYLVAYLYRGLLPFF